MSLGGFPEEQLLLLPARSPAEAAAWGSAAMEYAAAFETVHFARDPAQVDWRTYQHVTIIRPAFWPADLPVLIKQQNPAIVTDHIDAETPDILRSVLHVRVYYGWRYGPQTATDWAQIWPPGQALIGLHGRTTGDLQKADLSVIKAARIEAVKLTSHATAETFRALRALNPNLFLMARPMVDFTSPSGPRVVKPADFVSWTVDDLDRLVRAAPDLRYIEIHNEPNVTLEGFGVSWRSGKEFGDWFLDVMARYRARYPTVLFGFPGLSPGPASAAAGRADPEQFLDEAAFAVVEADWVGIHAYWVNDSELADRALGLLPYRYRDRFAEKLLFVTEFGNPIQAKDLVAEQYARYYAMLRQMPGLGGLFAYVVSTPNPLEAGWAWRDEAGNDRGLAGKVGQRPYILEEKP
jgi:hypothetical protein